MDSSIIGRRVVVQPTALRMPWASESLLKPGMIGTIITVTQDGNKVGVEFGYPIWYKDNRYNNGCFGKGKKDHCIYLPGQYLKYAEDCVTPEDNTPTYFEEILLLC